MIIIKAAKILSNLLTIVNTLLSSIEDEMGLIKKNILLGFFKSMKIGANKYKFSHKLSGELVID